MGMCGYVIAVIVMGIPPFISQTNNNPVPGEPAPDNSPITQADLKSLDPIRRYIAEQQQEANKK